MARYVDDFCKVFQRSVYLLKWSTLSLGSWGLLLRSPNLSDSLTHLLLRGLERLKRSVCLSFVQGVGAWYTFPGPRAVHFAK